MPRFLKILIVIILLATLVWWFWSRGGPQPMNTVEQPVAIPAASGSVE